MLSIPAENRADLWNILLKKVERYASEVHLLPVSPVLDPGAVRGYLRQFQFQYPLSPENAIDVAADGLTRWQVHTPHPCYFGLFNPAPTTMGIAADTLTAAFNPQMAAWSHNPFANEVENHVVRAIGSKFGYTNADGTFCSGGMEANHTALLTALTHHFPGFATDGLASLPLRPVLYTSSESHHSILKAARMAGLGTVAVRQVPVDEKLRLRVDVLCQWIQQDRASGLAPFLVVATAGTTSAGVVDPLTEIADLCEREFLWMHTDAAWGGAAVLLPEFGELLHGIGRSDSITFDAHKWFSVPMGAGVYLTRHPEILSQTFHVTSAYMPKDATDLDVVDPHTHSMQWSRRFTGLKVFLSLLVAGWDGYASAIRHQASMGDLLRTLLRDTGWNIANDTVLPVVCFEDPGKSPEHQRAIANLVVASGKAWISPTVIAGRTVIRACITHYGTAPDDIDTLVKALHEARAQLNLAPAFGG
ncbi:MAG: aminotransferase class V-fold PLP-dependent enzyme [Bryobacteraceae bacterium]|nr:aminotransferase class V-fold PLP-dependent enzyme [Bryobacteraceae bacterium]